MEVLIKFDDSNKELAKAIGLGLASYGMGPLLGMNGLSTTTTAKTTKKVGDVELTETETTKVEPADEKKVDTAAAFATTADDKAEPATTTTPADDIAPELIEADTDEHGVPFDAGFCAKSADKPFYATGPRTGQWKKKRGLAQETYDAWYTGQRPGNTAPEPGKVDTAAAFAASTAEQTAVELPTEPGHLLKWCAEQTAAGRFTTDDVTAAYTACGITVADMFGPEAATHVQAILAVLLK